MGRSGQLPEAGDDEQLVQLSMDQQLAARLQQEALEEVARRRAAHDEARWMQV